jgi:cold shock protein
LRHNGYDVSPLKFDIYCFCVLRELALIRFLKGIVMNIGTVKFFDANRGFGFIQPDDGSKDVFVHVTAVERSGLSTIAEGQKLSFDVVQDSRSGKSGAQNLQQA